MSPLARFRLWLEERLSRKTFSPLFSVYHFSLALLSAMLYGFPSRTLIVIGVTGTKGKSTVCRLIASVLEAGGFKVGLATTVEFQVGDKRWPNDKK